MRLALLCFVGSLVWTPHVRAQPEAEPAQAQVLTPVKFDPTTCKPPEVDKTKPKAGSDQVKSIPISLTDFVGSAKPFLNVSSSTSRFA